MEPLHFTDEYFMRIALKEADKALAIDEVPIGAVIVCNNSIIARAHNLTERLNDVTAHAEMQAFTAAANHLGAKFLDECTLYVTVEPCVMCGGASYWARIGKIVYGTKDPKRGYSYHTSELLHPKTKVVAGVLEDECRSVIQDYFRKKREI